MDCSCAVDVYSGDFEPVELAKYKMRTAIKPHECRECRRVIEPKEKYEHCSFKFDGSFHIEKYCTDCLSARDQFFPHGGHCDLWLDIAEEINGSDGEIPESCIADLTPKAREKLCDMIDEYFTECC